MKVKKNPVFSMVFPFLLVSFHIAVQVGFVELGTILAPQTIQQTKAQISMIAPTKTIRTTLLYTTMLRIEAQ